MENVIWKSVSQPFTLQGNLLLHMIWVIVSSVFQIINWTKLDGGGIYLHFLLFKKTPYYKTDLYWREGFYKIPEDYDFEKGGIIEITTEGIKLKEDNRWKRAIEFC